MYGDRYHNRQIDITIYTNIKILGCTPKTNIMFYVNYTSVKIKNTSSCSLFILKDPTYRNYWLMFKATLHYLILLEKFHYFSFKGVYKILKLSHGRNLSHFSFYFLSPLQLGSFSFFLRTGYFGSVISIDKYSKLPPTGLWKASTSVWGFFLTQINIATLKTFSTKCTNI